MKVKVLKFTKNHGFHRNKRFSRKKTSFTENVTAVKSWIRLVPTHFWWNTGQKTYHDLHVDTKLLGSASVNEVASVFASGCVCICVTECLSTLGRETILLWRLWAAWSLDCCTLTVFKTIHSHVMFSNCRKVSEHLTTHSTPVALFNCVCGCALCTIRELDCLTTRHMHAFV